MGLDTAERLPILATDNAEDEWARLYGAEYAIVGCAP